jgi:hypothetical protein
MATFVHALVTTLADRWHEVDVLLERARKEENNPACEFHDVLCRASVVLVVAHLEGFVRDCARAILNDTNQFSTFLTAPGHFKRTFCNMFVRPDDASGHRRVEKLMTLLDGLDTKFVADPFLFEGKNEDSRNPSPAVIERIARNFGIEKFFGLMATSVTDVVFTNVAADISSVTNSLRTHLLVNVETFPYTVDPIKFGLAGHSPIKKGDRTLWETFLDNLLKKRHDIAHGSDRLNGSSVAEIEDFKAKSIVLQYAFAILLCKSAV